MYQFRKKRSTPLSQPSKHIAQYIIGSRTGRHVVMTLSLIFLIQVNLIYLLCITPFFEEASLTNSEIYGALTKDDSKIKEAVQTASEQIDLYNSYLKMAPRPSSSQLLDLINQLSEKYYVKQGSTPYPVLFVVLEATLITQDSGSPVDKEKLKQNPIPIATKHNYSIQINYGYLLTLVSFNLVFLVVFFSVLTRPRTRQQVDFEEKIIDDYFRLDRPLNVAPKIGTSDDRILICTAIDVETDAVIAHLINIQHQMIDGANFSVGQFKSAGGKTWNVYVRQVGKGNYISAGESARAISSIEGLSIGLFVGIAGAIKDADIGDVVVSRQIFNYEEGKYEEETPFKPRPNAWNSSRSLVEKALYTRAIGHWKTLLKDEDKSDFRILIDTTISGEKVIAALENETIANINHYFSNAVALDMEGTGFLCAATTANINAIVIRGISDLLRDKHASDSSGWQEISARRAASFAFGLITEL